MERKKSNQILILRQTTNNNLEQVIFLHVETCTAFNMLHMCFHVTWSTLFLISPLPLQVFRSTAVGDLLPWLHAVPLQNQPRGSGVCHQRRQDGPSQELSRARVSIDRRSNADWIWINRPADVVLAAFQSFTAKALFIQCCFHEPRFLIT